MPRRKVVRKITAARLEREPLLSASAGARRNDGRGPANQRDTIEVNGL